MGQVDHVLPGGPFLSSSSSAYQQSRQAQMTPAYTCSFSGTRFNRRFNALSLLNATSMLSGRGGKSSLQRMSTEYLNPSQRILQINSSLDRRFSRRRSAGSPALWRCSRLFVALHSSSAFNACPAFLFGKSSLRCPFCKQTMLRWNLCTQCHFSRMGCLMNELDKHDLR
ncbi:hypothetical protein T06_4601 [Trichinella sp. T6]|nr:hypothetical protein T06_4601 [Trichinella sp. T6]